MVRNGLECAVMTIWNEGVLRSLFVVTDEEKGLLYNKIQNVEFIDERSSSHPLLFLLK